jgi:predicted alpha/beta hydrolase
MMPEKWEKVLPRVLAYREWKRWCDESQTKFPSPEIIE